MDEVLAAIEQLGQDIHDYEFYNSIAELDTIPDSATWYRDFVSRNRPCVVRGAVSHWPATQTWDLDRIQERMGHAQVTCTFTCDGKADAIQQQDDGSSRFLLPDNRKMTMEEFVTVFRQSKANASPVPSVQYQNNNLAEFESLTKDIDTSFAWALEAFGAATPDAVNLWIGDKRSTTTFHKVCPQSPLFTIPSRRLDKDSIRMLHCEGPDASSPPPALLLFSGSCSWPCVPRPYHTAACMFWVCSACLSRGWTTLSSGARFSHHGSTTTCAITLTPARTCQHWVVSAARCSCLARTSLDLHSLHSLIHMDINSSCG